MGDLVSLRSLSDVFGIDESILQYQFEWVEGSRVKAKEVASAYIEAHREQLTPILGNLTMDQIVKAIELERHLGRIANRLVLDMWLLSEFEPQEITGVIDVVLPDPRALMEALRA